MNINNEIKSLEYSSKRANAYEPCLITMMRGMGKGEIYNIIAKNLPKVPNKSVYSNVVANEKEFDELLKHIESTIAEHIFVIYIASEKDSYEQIVKLNSLRIKYSRDFVCVIVSSIKPIFTAMKDGIKIVTKSIFICKPVNFDDSKIVIQNLENVFNFTFPKEKHLQAFELSGGNIGLIKSIFMQIWEDQNFNLSVENLLKNKDVVSRLKSIKDELNDEVWIHVLNNDLNFKDSEILKDFQIIKDNKIFSPLFEEYLRRTFKIVKDRDQVFSAAEAKFYSHIKNISKELLSRDNIAKIIWEENWADRYSDWAIDKFMSRFKKKVKNIDPSIIIETKKGRGFLVNHV